MVENSLVVEMNRRKDIAIRDTDKLVPMKEDERVVLTHLQVEAAKRKVKGYSDYAIGRELGTDAKSIKNSLEALKRNYRKALWYIKEVRKTRFFAKSFADPELWRKAYETRMQRKRKGYIYGRAPFGYGSPEEAALVRRIFEMYVEGKSTLKIEKELGINRVKVWLVLQRDIYTKRCYHGQRKFEPMVSEKLREKVERQRRLRARFPITPQGFKMKDGFLWKDPDLADKINLAFRLFAEGKSIRRISRKVGIPTATLSRVLSNPLYCGKREVNGKLQDDPDVAEIIIDYKTWKKVQKRPDPWSYAVSKQLKKSNENRKAVLAALPGTVAQISTATKLGRPTIWRYLKNYRNQGLVEKVGGKYGKWYVTEKLAKSVGLEYSDSVKFCKKLDALGSPFCMRKILPQLPARLHEIVKATGLSQAAVSKWLRKLENIGIVEKRPQTLHGSFHVKEEFSDFVKKWLSLEY